MIVCLIYTLTISAAPYINSIKRESHSIDDTANTAVAEPNTIIEIIKFLPALFIGGSCVRIIPVKTPPTAGIVLNKPKPSGPIFKISMANIGSIPIMPPNKTANKSRDIVPRISFVFQTYTKPLMTTDKEIDLRLLEFFGFFNRSVDKVEIPKQTIAKK